MNQEQVVSAFAEYAVLDTIDKEHRKQMNPRKRGLQKTVLTTMLAKNEKMHTEDGKHFFVLASEKPKAKLNKKFRQLAYENFQMQLGRELVEDEFEKLEAYTTNTRERAGGEVQTKVKLSRSRPPEAFF